MNKEKSIMRERQVQSKNSAAVSFSYQIRQKDNPTVIIDKCQMVLEEQRLTAYYHGLCQIRKHDIQNEEFDDGNMEENPDE